ncbi:hypothetical protein SHKM778_94740 (plasmid) [Streptomyces sp. KM77-8]|uniref:XRE family transcriptional regulator n=1 Tax=Streptomyces haneummycinicus TaxID=3074435 RepID=A0AAT9I094_9ACTN
MPAQPLLQHPLAALRSQLGLTAGKYLDLLDDSHHALGYGRMAKRREKVSRWESGINAPTNPPATRWRTFTASRRRPSPNSAGPISSFWPSPPTAQSSTAPGPLRVPWKQ